MNTEQDRRALLDKCATLSRREKEVLQGLAQRRRAKEIGRDLNISEHTVRSYANDARQKLGVTSVREAALIFLEFEKEQSPPQNQRDHFQRVSENLSEASGSEGGLSKPSQDYQMQKRPSRLAALHAWLAGLGPMRWLGLTLLLTLSVVTTFAVAAMIVLGAFEVLHQVGVQHR